jgi:DNA transposition AAA+ family ATPase
MELSTKKRIALEAKLYIKENAISQTDLAVKADVRKEYMSNMFKYNSDFTVNAGNDKTVVIPDKYFDKIADFIGYSYTKTYWDNQATTQFSSVIANLQESKAHGTTNVIIGATGSGKSHCINLFRRKNPSATFIVTVGSSDNLSDLIDKVIDELKLTTGKSKSKKIRDIAQKLRSLKDNGLTPQLIFDEAEYMKQPALCSMKELHDYLNEYCSIVLMGTDQLLTNLDVMRKKNKQGIPQFYRRIKFGIRQLPHIDKSFDLFLTDIESNDVKKFLRTICDNYGELHDVLVPVRRAADKTGEEITEQLIRKVLNLPNNLNARY